MKLIIYFISIVLTVIYVSGCSLTNHSDTTLIYGNDGLTIAPKDIPTVTSAADHGDVNAALRLYLYYEAVANNPEKARHYLTLSAEGGNPTAQYNLGVVLLESNQEETQKEAIRWLRKAADNGVDKAQTLLETRRPQGAEKAEIGRP